MNLIFDFETRSPINLKLAGAYVYAQHPQTDALLASFKLRFDLPWSQANAAVKAWVAASGPLNVICRWRRGEPCPPYVRAYVEAGGEISAFNASFERLIWWNVMTPRYGWPKPRTEQFRCTMATARALGLPAQLSKLGEALDLKIKKDKRGDALIKIHSIPQKFAADGTPVWHPLADDPASLADFHDYCDTDVLSEEEAAERMIPLSDAEMAVYHMSETINDRGVRVDVASIKAAIALVEKAKVDLDERMRVATGGAVTAASQVARLTKWLASRGVTLDGVAKDDILEALDLDLPHDAREALLIRQEAAKTSTAKLNAFLKHADARGRIPGMFIYHGTGPGRWTSAGGVNLSNLPRPRAIYDNAELDVATLFKAFRTSEPQMLREMYGDDLGKPMHLVSDTMRGFLCAAPGHEFIIVDYSGIQGAIAAWLSKEEWKLQAMREIIADPTRPDLYRVAAAGILNTTTDVITKKHAMRQAVGKTSELALAFGGGVSALVGMAANYGMRRAALHALYEPVWGSAADEAREKAIKRWEKNMKSRDRRKTDVLSREAWLACSLIVSGWRARNPAHEAAWGELEHAMREAVRNPGQKIAALGRITYLVANGFLWLRLPSGRCVAHAQPRLKDQVWAKLKLADGSWGESEVVDREEAERLELRGLAKIEGKTSPKVSVLGFDSTTQKMIRYGLYGGLAMQNNCLGAESDILRHGVKRCEEAGYPIVMHCYDEAVAEKPRGVGSVEEMSALMLDLEPWTTGLPLTCHGERVFRYKK